MDLKGTVCQSVDWINISQAMNYRWLLWTQ